MKKVGTVKFNNIDYEVLAFRYMSGRKGLMLQNGTESFNGTLDIANIPVKEGEVIVKNHDLNFGLLDCLMDNNVIGKQSISRKLGNNLVFICKLIDHGKRV